MGGRYWLGHFNWRVQYLETFIYSLNPILHLLVVDLKLWLAFRLPKVKHLWRLWLSRSFINKVVYLEKSLMLLLFFVNLWNDAYIGRGAIGCWFCWPREDNTSIDLMLPFNNFDLNLLFMFNLLCYFLGSIIGRLTV